MATLLCQVILLVIISNNILLSLSFAFTYKLFLLNYIQDIPNFIHLLLKIGVFLLHC